MKTAGKNKVFPVVLGIDWSDQKHDICLWNSKDQSLDFDVVKHRPEVLHDWVCKLRNRFPGVPIAIGLEQ